MQKNLDSDRPSHGSPLHFQPRAADVMEVTKESVVEAKFSLTTNGGGRALVAVAPRPSLTPSVRMGTRHTTSSASRELLILRKILCDRTQDTSGCDKSGVPTDHLRYGDFPTLNTTT
jgi:hypothetical protein